MNAAAKTGWTVGLPAQSGTIVANGNRSYDVPFASTVAAILSPGMRLRTTRTVAAPTQCTSLNGSTQYYSKTTPAGMTFTDDFVVSAWIKLTSYTDVGIVSRYNGTSGWALFINAAGTVQMTGYNAGAANTSSVTSYQSVPLNKWVHITAQLDMSAFTATTTTSYIMLDGVDIPATVTRAGTNPTTLIQAGDLQVGARNALIPFPGKIAQVAIYSAKVTQATIKASMNQTLSGTETSLISAYSFNNTINDLNANANNLTANGSAVATNADSPFGGQADGTISSTLDYAIVTKVATTTVTVQVPEGCTIPTSGGVSAVSYSTQKAPYGMPISRGKWTVLTQFNVSSSKVAATGSTWYGDSALTFGGPSLSVPLGDWILSYQSVIQGTRNTTTFTDVSSTLSTTSSSETDKLFTSKFANTASGAAGSNTIVGIANRSNPATLATATLYYLNLACTSTGIDISIQGSVGYTTITAENAYL